MEKRLGVLSNKQPTTSIKSNVRDLRTPIMPEMQTQSSSQGINYYRIFVDGSRHKIHLRIIISHATPITRERPPGFSKEGRIRNGSQKDPSPYSGFMENVCPYPILPPDAANNIGYL